MLGLLPAYQLAYCKYHSCKTSLLNLTDTILWNMEKQWVTSCLVINLRTTFDLVDHSIILDVLSKQYRVSDNALKWFDSYLRPHGFKVNVDGHYSSYKEIFSSVPQGSCSGPQLYSVYASTMRYVLNNDWPFDLVPPQGYDGSIELNGFADDHLLNKGFNLSVRLAELFTKWVMEHSLSEIDNWMHQNCLKMNSQKTEFIYFGSKRQLSKCEIDDIIVCRNTVTRVGAIKLLGMDLDSQLSFKSHIVRKSRTAMFSLLKIKHIRKHLTVQACEVLIHSLVMSHLDYGNSLFFGLPDCNINKLQRVQNAAAKVVLQSRRMDSWTECFMELHWLPIRACIEHKILMLVYSSVHCLAPKYLSDKIQHKADGRPGLQSSNDFQALVVPRTKHMTFADGAYSVSVPKLWNKLPTSVKSAPDLDTFKKNLKTHLFVREFMSK